MYIYLQVTIIRKIFSSGVWKYKISPSDSDFVPQCKTIQGNAGHQAGSIGS